MANLFEFMRPRYQALPLPALDAYLYLLTDLMNALPIVSFEIKQILPEVDPHTKERLTTILGVDHLVSLLTASHRHICTLWSLSSFVLSLVTIWPDRRESVLSTLLVCTDSKLVTRLYEGFVREPPLGRDYNPGALMGMYISLPRLHLLTIEPHRPILRNRMASAPFTLRSIHPIPSHDGRRRILRFHL